MYIQKSDGSVTSVPDGTALQPGWTQIDEATAQSINPALTGTTADPAVTKVQMHDGAGTAVNYTVQGQPILTVNPATTQHTIPNVPSTGIPTL